MSLAHFLAEYAAHPFFGPYYDHWLHDGNYGWGGYGNIWQPDWSSFEGERTPPLDWYELDTTYTLKIEIPGVRREDITMHVADDGRSLTIEGTTEKHGGAGSRGLDDGKSGNERPRVKKVRKTMADGSTVIITRVEKKHSVGSTVKFTRTVTLPTYVDNKRISAKLNDGVLTVTIPKLHTPKPRRVVID